MTPGELAPIVDSETKKIKVGYRVEPFYGPTSNLEHVHHPDAYHPDPRKRIEHQREMMRRGFAVAACGLEHDPALRMIEASAGKRCARCVEVTEAAKADHEKALTALEDAARARAIPDQAETE